TVTLTAPALAPVVVGVKVTPTAQLAPAASEAGQALLAIANWLALAPLRATDEIASAALPVLLTVIVWAAEVVLMTWLPKAIDAGASASTGAAAVVPVPVSATEPDVAGAATVTLTAAA